MKGVGEMVYVKNQRRARDLIALGILENPFSDAKPVVTAAVDSDSFTDKTKLDDWAMEEHGIKLNRTMKLENMKADFAKKYEAKMQKPATENKAMATGSIENK